MTAYGVVEDGSVVSVVVNAEQYPTTLNTEVVIVINQEPMTAGLLQLLPVKSKM